MDTPFFPPSRQRIGLIGGLGALAGADVHAKLLRGAAQAGPGVPLQVLFEQRHGDTGAAGPRANAAALTARKLYVYDMLQRLAWRGAGSVLVPCFISRTFLPELQAELALPVVDILLPLRAALRQRGPGPCRVGILTTDYVRQRGLFETAFGADGHTVLYPDGPLQAGCVMAAVYGRAGGAGGAGRSGRAGSGGSAGGAGGGLQAGAVRHAAGLLLQACAALLAAGADVIVPGATEIAMVAGLLAEAGMPVLDSNQLYVDHALRERAPARPRPFQIGIVGGVGPAATADFMHKIIVNTAARADQEHLPLLVEHNPAIPDRTAHLVGQGADPTLALYAACRRLEQRGAGLIAIPCNTAHAYLGRLAPRLAIPIVDMLAETVAQIGGVHGAHDGRRVGLLATTGTLASRVYHGAARGAPFELIVPDAAHQALVMRAVYGRHGVKAGFLDGQCRTDLWQALLHLAGRGATLVILGCTELPLLLSEGRVDVGGRHVVLLDPTAILARRCVALAQAKKNPG